MSRANKMYKVTKIMWMYIIAMAAISYKLTIAVSPGSIIALLVGSTLWAVLCGIAAFLILNEKPRSIKEIMED